MRVEARVTRAAAEACYKSVLHRPTFAPASLLGPAGGAAAEGQTAAAPEPIFLPQDLAAFYRAHIDDQVGPLSDAGVSGRSSEELHQLIDTVVVPCAAEAPHAFDFCGDLLEELNVTKPAFGAGLDISDSALILVAGGGVGLWRTFLTIGG